MAVNIYLSRLQLFRKVNSCLLCSRANLNAANVNSAEPNLQEEKAPKTKKPRIVGVRKHVREINQFFKENPDITRFEQFIPSKILSSRPYNNPDYLYLVSPDVARSIADHVWQGLEGQNQIIGESSPGFGLITEFLLQKGITSVRLYESNNEFQQYLQEVFKENYAVTHYKKDFFGLWRYAYVDKMDQGQRVTQLLEGIPKKSWTHDPVMTVVGTITKKTFLIFLIQSIVLQRDIGTYGRIDLFLITYEKVWKLFSASREDCPQLYITFTILLQIFFEARLIDKYPRKFFLPWQSAKKGKLKQTSVSKLDTDHLYLIKVTMKKDFPLPADQFVPFYCFINTLFGRGNASVIATCEKWVPGSGENLLLPKLAHVDYFEDLDVFTKFKELNPMQTISVFRELVADPNYPNSPFLDMVEQEMLKSETIETYLHDAHNKISSI